MVAKGPALPGKSHGKLKPLSVTEALFSKLHKDIINGRYPPGFKLKLEQLRAIYGVGSSPLREALSRLTVMGLVRQEIQRGFKVAPASLEDLRDIVENRTRFETIALQLSIEKGDDEWESIILSRAHLLSKKIYVQDKQNPEINREWERCHRDFHISLIQACDSYWLLYFCGLLYDQFDRYRRMAVGRSLDRRILDQEHHEFLTLALERKADQACELLVGHIRKSIEVVMAGLEALS